MEMALKLPATENNPTEVKKNSETPKFNFRASTAPKAPPDETPKVYGVARSFLNKTWKTDPIRERDAPIKNAKNTRGKRILKNISASRD